MVERWNTVGYGKARYEVCYSASSARTVKPLLSEDEIRAGVGRLAKQILDRYAPHPLTIIGVLTGSVVFLADLIRRLDLPLRVGVVQARSYRGEATTPGPLTIDAGLMPDIRGRDVLLIDDIFDTGHTLFELIALVGALGPSSVHSAVLLRKKGRQQVEFQPDFVGFDIPNEFVVGYGLDYRDAYRNLPYVAALEPADLQAEPPDRSSGRSGA